MVFKAVELIQPVQILDYRCTAWWCHKTFPNPKPPGAPDLALSPEPRARSPEPQHYPLAAQSLEPRCHPPEILIPKPRHHCHSSFFSTLKQTVPEEKKLQLKRH